MDIDGAVSVREASKGDLPRLRSLHKQLYRELGATAEHVAAEAWGAIAATPGRTIYVADVGGVVVGTADLTVMANMAHRGEPYLLVENVVVDHAHRRHGVGAALLEAAAALGRAAGCYKLQLSADDFNAYAFYEAAGWEHTARTYKLYLDE
jgi:GNAT superfamily N-acetyltransferase